MISILPLLQFLSFAACITVEADTIRMRDLAKANPAFAGAEPDFRIGHAPAAGAIRRLSPGHIQALAESQGIRGIDPQEVCFQRATAVLTKAMLTEVLQNALAPQRVRVEILDFSRFPLPKGELEFPLQGLSMPQQPSQPAYWRGALRDGSRRIPLWAKVSLSGRCTRIYAVRKLPPGEEIPPDAIRFETVDGYPAHPTCVEPAVVIGKAPKRSIAPDSQVVPSLLDSPIIVRRGELLAVESRMQGILLRMDAIAERDGRAGDNITVRNPSSGQKLAARVEAPGKALLTPKIGATR